jgi:hypothetical protein
MEDTPPPRVELSQFTAAVANVCSMSWKRKRISSSENSVLFPLDQVADDMLKCILDFALFGKDALRLPCVCRTFQKISKSLEFKYLEIGVGLEFDSQCLISGRKGRIGPRDAAAALGAVQSLTIHFYQWSERVTSYLDPSLFCNLKQVYLKGQVHDDFLRPSRRLVLFGDWLACLLQAKKQNLQLLSFESEDITFSRTSSTIQTVLSSLSSLQSFRLNILCQYQRSPETLEKLSLEVENFLNDGLPRSVRSLNLSFPALRFSRLLDLKFHLSLAELRLDCVKITSKSLLSCLKRSLLKNSTCHLKNVIVERGLVSCITVVSGKGKLPFKEYFGKNFDISFHFWNEFANLGSHNENVVCQMLEDTVF